MKKSKFLLPASFFVFALVPMIFSLGLPGCQRSSLKDTEVLDTITILDGKSRVVKLKLPINNIISLSSGITSLICAFGDEDKIIGRDSYSTFPSGVLPVDEVAKSSAAPNIELILEKKPDVVFTDSQIHDEEIAKLADCEIPVVTDVTSDPERIFFLIRNMGLILDKKEKAEEIIDFMEGYLDTVHERISDLDLKEKALPKVYFESHSEYKSASSQTSYHKTIVEAGAINIAASELSKLPVLSPEWIIEENPDVIIRRVSGDESYEEMKALRDEIASRPGFRNIAAVQNGKVFIIKSDVFMTLRYPIGLLYYAIYFHPDIFGDINPVKAHRDLIIKFLGEKEWNNISECFAFP